METEFKKTGIENMTEAELVKAGFKPELWNVPLDDANYDQGIREYNARLKSLYEEGDKEWTVRGPGILSMMSTDPYWPQTIYYREKQKD